MDKKSIILLVVCIVCISAIVITINFDPRTDCVKGVEYFRNGSSNPTPVYNPDGTIATCQE